MSPVAAASLLVVLTAAPVPKVGPARDRDGFVLPAGATARLGSLTFRGPRAVGLTFSADGKQLLMPDDRTVSGWDAATGRPLPPKTFTPAEPHPVRGASVLAGDRLVWLWYDHNDNPSGKDASVVVLRLADGNEVSRFRINGRPYFDAHNPRHWASAAVTPDGKYLAAVEELDEAVGVYDLGTGRRLHAVPCQPRWTKVAVSGDGTTLYVNEHPNPVRGYDLRTGVGVKGLALGTLIQRLEGGPDGKRLVTQGTRLEKDAAGQVVAAVGEDFLDVRDGATGKPTGRLAVGATPTHFRFAGPDSLVVLATKYRPPATPEYTLSRWDLVTGKSVWAAPLGPGWSWHEPGWVAVSADGKRVAVHDLWHVAQVFDAATGKPVVVPAAHPGEVAWVGWSADGQTVTTAGAGEVRTWAATGEPKGRAEPPELARGYVTPWQLGDGLAWVTFDPDGKKPELVGWDHGKGAVGWRLPLAGRPPGRLLTPDGKRVVGVEEDRDRPEWRAAAYDGPAGTAGRAWAIPPTPPGQSGGPAVALSGDAKTLFVGGDGVTAFDAATGKERGRVAVGTVQPVDHGSPTTLAASADGSRVALVVREEFRNEQVGLVSRQAVRVYEVATGKVLADHPVERMHGAAVRFSPDGKRVAVWNFWSREVLVCDAEGAAKPRAFDGGVSRATAAAFSPDGRTLAVGYMDGTTVLWDVSAP